jgi:YbbR domain-containing protein
MTFRPFDNLALKLLSLVLGFALWYIVAGGQGAEIVLPVPIEFRNMPAGMEIVSESVNSVDVRVRGSSEILRSIAREEIEVSVDLAEAGAGTTTFYLSPEQVRVPFGVRAIRVAPAVLHVELDRTREATVRVMPRVVGEPASGFELAAVQLHPQHVQLTGPSSRLTGIEQVTTEPISVQGLREPFTQPTQIRLDDPLIRPAGPSKVMVHLTVREEYERIELKGIPVTSLPDDGAPSQLTPTSVEGVFAVPRSAVGKLQAEDLRAVVMVEGLSPGVHSVAPELRAREEGLPPFEVVSIHPEKIRVRISGGLPD